MPGLHRRVQRRLHIIIIAIKIEIQRTDEILVLLLTGTASEIQTRHEPLYAAGYAPARYRQRLRVRSSSCVLLHAARFHLVVEQKLDDFDITQHARDVEDVLVREILRVDVERHLVLELAAWILVPERKRKF